METDNDKNNEMRYHAYRGMNVCEMLLKQCDSWLSAEEGNRNMEKQIIERRRRESNVPKICRGGFQTRPCENDKNKINKQFEKTI